MTDDIVDVLNRIKCCVDDNELRIQCGFIPSGSSKKEIFKTTDIDGIINNKIMDDTLNKTKDMGLIMNESGKKKWAVEENWTLTKAGEAHLGVRGDKKRKAELDDEYES